MPIASRTVREITYKLEHHVRECYHPLNNSLVYEGTNKPLDGTALYVHLFGCTRPITVTLDATPSMTAIFEQMADIKTGYNKGIRYIGRLVEVPRLSTKPCSLRVPLTYGSEMLSLLLPCSEPVLPLFYWTDQPITTKAVVDTSGYGAQSEALVNIVRKGIVWCYGEEVLATIDRILSIRNRISTVPDRTSAYARNGVASAGALYKKLPALLTLKPSTDVQHVTLTRGAKEPDPSLVEDLNLLATLVSANKG